MAMGIDHMPEASNTVSEDGIRNSQGVRTGCCGLEVRLPAVDTLKRYSKALEYEYRVKTAALDTLK
jgi:hypothetical protein